MTAAPSTLPVPSPVSDRAEARSGLLLDFLPVAVGGLVLIAVVVVGVQTPGFFSEDNVEAILRSAAITGIAAVGMAFITITGNFISLSSEGAAVFTAIVFALLSTSGVPGWATVALALGIATAIGCLQGLLVARGFNPIIATLGVGAVLTGGAAWISSLRTITIRDPSVLWVGRAEPLGFSMQVVAFVLLAIAATVFSLKHRYGRLMRLVGSNSEAARSSGLRPGRATVAAFTIAGAALGCAAVLQAAQFGQANTLAFGGLTFEIIAAVLVGGVAVSGGRGTPGGAAIGAVLIATLSNLMLLRGYSFGTRTLILGLLVGLAVALSHSYARRSS